MHLKNLIVLQSIDIIKLLVFLSIIAVSLCARGPYQPKSMDYELRRPITYLYNRLAYKFDFNPYTSHLVNTQKVCSSRTGPYCGFINKRELMQQKLPIQVNYLNLHHALVVSAPQNKQVAFQIERGELDVFLISGDSHKEFDKYVKGQIEKDFYDALPSHKKIPQPKKVQTQKRKSMFGFVPNAN